MIVIGLVGPFASGKSTVAKMLGRHYNAEVIDADAIGHNLLKTDKAVIAKVVAAFGTVDRPKLRGMVFKSKDNLKKLDAIMHPVMKKRILNDLEDARKEGVKLVVIEAAVLLDMGLGKAVDEIWLVKAEESLMFKRGCAKGISADHVRDILNMARPMKEFSKCADATIENTGSERDLEYKVKHLMMKLIEKTGNLSTYRKRTKNIRG
jgi:dephospho-CoA kinase